VASLSSRPSFAALLAAADATPTRVLCTGGVVWVSAGGGRWRVDAGHDFARRDAERGDVSPALPVTAVDRWCRMHAVRPVVLAAPDAFDGEHLTLASAVGALGWRPPLDVLAAGDAEGARRLRRAALHLRPLVDAAEQHALDAVERYARAAATAGRVARLLDAPALETVGAPPGLFVAVDALAGAGLRTLAAADALAAGVFRRGLLGAPGTIRAVLAEVRAAHAAPAVARRRRLLRHAAAGLGPPAVRVRRLRVADGATWAVRVPVGAGRRVDAFEAAWELTTEAWHALALVAYAAAGAWAFE